MAERPKRTIPRRDYSSLANVKLPRKKRNTNCNLSRGSIEGETANYELYRLEIVDENMETSQVKVVIVQTVMSGEQELKHDNS